MKLMKRAWMRFYTVLAMPDYVMGEAPFPASMARTEATQELARVYLSPKPFETPGR